MSSSARSLSLRLPAWLARACCALALGSSPGCSWDQLNPFVPPAPPPPPAESYVLRPDGFVASTTASQKASGPEAMLAGAHELFRREEYAKAERVYHYLADKTNNAPNLRQEAMYYRAECLRLQEDYPKAADVYAALLKEFLWSAYREQAVQHIYEIAHYWLQDTWEEMKEYGEYQEGKRWMYWPRFVSFEKKKPLVDREGRAVERLVDVRTHDLKGPYADKALYLMGHVALYNENYAEADTSFSSLFQEYPQSKYANEAMEKAIYCKQKVMGGPDYDGRKVAEARKMVDAALRTPHLDPEAKKKLEGQLAGINLQQALKDYKMAEFFEHIHKPGAAYWYYDIVRRRYVNTPLAHEAEKRMNALYAAAMKDQASRPTNNTNTAPAQKSDAPPAVAPDPGQMGMGMGMGTAPTR